MPRLLFAIALGFAGAALAAAAENYVTITAPSTPLRVGASHMASPVGTVTQGQRTGVDSRQSMRCQRHG
jgi:hypothetical protein